MTNTVKGAGRTRYAAQKAKHDQRDPVVGGKRDDALKAAAEATKTPARKRAAKKTAATADQKASRKAAVSSASKKTAAKKTAAKPAAGGDQSWDKDASLGSNTDRLKNAGVTWRGIAEMATANGIEMPYPDGGRLLRARKQHLAGTEGKTAAPGGRRASTKRKHVPTPEDKRSFAQVAKDKIALADVPWDAESTDEELMAFVAGRTIEWVNSHTAVNESARIPKDGPKTEIKHGESGPYISWVSTEGPWRNVSFSRIVRVS